MVTYILFGYSTIFFVAMSYAQILLFSGILFKAGSSKFYQFPGKMPSFFGFPQAFLNLKMISFPVIGGLAWCLGVVLISIALIRIFKNGFLSDLKKINGSFFKLVSIHK